MKYNRFIQYLSVCLVALLPSLASAGIIEELIDPDAVYTGPSVEERIALMDTDKNGFCDVHEIRKFLEKEHGKDYKQSLLARLEANAVPRSCGTSVAEMFAEE